MKEGLKIHGFFSLEHWRDGKLLNVQRFENTVVNVGLQHILDVAFSSLTEVAPWFLGLTDGTPTVAAGDILSSHVGWVEETDYTGDRQEWVEVRSGQSMTNAASVAVFPITGSATIGGAFLCSVATTTSGVLMSAGALTGGDRSVVNLDTLNLTYTMTVADS